MNLRRIVCWLRGHRGVWIRKESPTADILFFHLDCERCRAELHTLGYTRTAQRNMYGKSFEQLVKDDMQAAEEKKL